MTKYAPGASGLLAPFKPWLENSTVSEIMVNKPQVVWVEMAGRMQSHSVPELTDKRLRRLFQLITTENQQKIDAENPIVSASLPDGARIQLIIPPVSQYPTLAIRRQTVQRLSLMDYEQHNFYTRCRPVDYKAETPNQLDETDQALCELYQANAWSEFIRQAIRYKKVIVISGATSSGKTTFLNACLQEISEQERLILIEDTREIIISHPNHVSLLAVKSKVNEASSQRITMQDLVQASLRLRPDRIVVGEIRGREILDFLSACSTGHEGSITSIHANNPRMAFMRMKQMYRLNDVAAMRDQDIRAELNQVIDIIVQLKKYPDSGRQVSSIYYKHAHLLKKEWVSGGGLK